MVDAKFYLEFEFGTFPIDKPIDFDDVKISLKKVGKFAKEIQINGDLTFINRPIKYGHELKRIINVFNESGDESIIYLIAETAERNFKWRLDFLDCKTDKESFFTTKIITDSSKKYIEDNKNIKVDVFSMWDINGNNINYMPFENVELYPKEIQEQSIHTTGNESLEVVSTAIVYDAGGDNTLVPIDSIVAMWNPWGALLTDQSENASEYYVPPDQPYVNPGPLNNVPDTYISGALSGIENFWFGQETLFNLKVSDLTFNFNIENAPSDIGLILQIALITYNNANRDNVINKEYLNLYTGYGKHHEINVDFQQVIPANSRLIYEFRAYAGHGYRRRPSDNVEVIGGMFESSRVSIFEKSTAKMARLYHVAQRVIKGLGLNLSLDSQLLFYDYFNSYVTSGSHIRRLLNDEFNVSFEDIRKFIQSAYFGDIQIHDDSVFIGRYRDFYTDVEVGRVEFKPNVDTFEIELNKELVKNELIVEFETYEKEERSTLDAFHTATEWYIPKRNEGKLEAKINFIADGYSIEYARRQGITEEPTTLKDKDDKIYVIDTVEVGGVRRNRQTQGYNSVTGIFSPSTVYNLLYSVKRLLINNYSERLHEINLTNKLPFISKNMKFIGNGDLNISGFGLDYVDSADILDSNLPNAPIISKEIYNFELNRRLQFSFVMKIMDDILKKRGFITFFDENIELKIYPSELDYDFQTGILTVKDEKKYEI